jgi:hypothetical protein
VRTFFKLIVSCVAMVLSSLGVACLFLALNGWFGAGDLEAFFYWTAMYIAPFAPLSLLFRIGMTGRRASVRVPAAAIVGAGCGFGWTYLVARTLGPWFGTFSFPVLYCWILASATGLFAATLFPHRRAPR